MATKKYAFNSGLKELRFLFCQTSEHSAPVRNFLTRSYPTMKKHNPYVPIMIREASGTEPIVYARYDFGKEKKLRLNGLDDKAIEKQVTELVEHPERDIIDLTEEDDEVQHDRRFIWVSQPNSDAEYPTSHTDNNCDNDQPTPQTNGTHSESLTRLQSGYLRCIANLEERTTALQQELDRVRAAPDNREGRVGMEAAHRIRVHEKHIEAVQQQLNETRTRPNPLRAENQQLKETLATKNQKIKEKNTKIVDLEMANGQLRRDLAEEEKKKKKSGANMEASRKMSTAQMKRKHAESSYEHPRGPTRGWGP